MKKGFTLAEVLITLAIIGVVAALTIPSVIVRTQQQEFKTAAKKAHSVLSQAVQLTEVKDGYTFQDRGFFVQALINNMNVVKVNVVAANDLPGISFAEESVAPTYGSGTIFYTADGIAYKVDSINRWGAGFLVDVNGDKGPSNLDAGNLSKASCKNGGNRCDWDDPEWQEILLTDLFVVNFKEDGSSNLHPWSGYPQ